MTTQAPAAALSQTHRRSRIRQDSGSSVLKQGCAESESVTTVVPPMLPNDGGGRWPLRQGRRHWPDTNGEPIATNRRRLSRDQSVLACTVTAVTATVYLIV